MPIPAEEPLEIYHGDTLSFTIGIAEDVDITGHTPKFQIREGTTLIKDWSAYATVTSAQLLSISVPGEPDAAGTFGLARPARIKLYDYDIQLTSPTGSVRTLLRGKAIVTADASYG